MKITIICDVLGQSNNGTTIATYNLINHLKKKGHEVKVVSSDQSTSGKENFYVVPKLNLGPFNYALNRNQVQLAKVDENVLTEAISDADIIHIQLPMLLGMAGVKIARKLNKPITASFHCQAENVTSHVGLMNFSPANDLTYKFFYKNVYQYCNKVHYPTQFIKETFEEHTHPTNAVVISNGVNDIFFQDTPFKRVSDKFTILCTGRYSKEKDQKTLIKAVAKSPYKNKIKLIFAGNGPKKNYLMKLAKKLDVDCEFNFYSRDDLLKILHGVDLYVHTAIIEIEAISCMEAIAAGLVPVICNSERSATRFFALDQNNLFEQNNVNSLTEKINFWYEHPEMKQEYNKRYQSIRNDFCQTTCMENMENMLLNTIEEYKKVS